jgi:hypothetical protein
MSAWTPAILTEIFRSFLQPLQAHISIAREIKRRLLSSKSRPINY